MKQLKGTKRRKARAGRVFMMAELTADARRCAEDVADLHGMIMSAATGRLIDWFVEQPEDVREAILNDYPAPAGPELVRRILEPMVGRPSTERLPGD